MMLLSKRLPHIQKLFKDKATTHNYWQQSRWWGSTPHSLLKHSKICYCCWLCVCFCFYTVRDSNSVTAVSRSLTLFKTPVGTRTRKQHISAASFMQQLSDQSHVTDVTRLLRSIKLSHSRMGALWWGCSASPLVISGDTNWPPGLHENSLMAVVTPANQMKSKLRTDCRPLILLATGWHNDSIYCMDREQKTGEKWFVKSQQRILLQSKDLD